MLPTQSCSSAPPRRRRLVGALAAVAVVAPLAPFGTPVPVTSASGALQSISFEASPPSNLVVLGDLASRSQRQPVTVAGIGPYTVSGTDSRTSSPYSFVTDRAYSSATAAYQRESDEGTVSSTFTSSITTIATDAVDNTRANVLRLFSNTNCANINNLGGVAGYCSLFGPEVWSVPFEASLGQAVSFDWRATGASDDYEIYAYLVKVEETAPSSGVYDYGTPQHHTVVAHGRGNVQGWTTASETITEAGRYRFRFVNGSYDATGGQALGSEMFIDSVVKVGLANPITFPTIGDKIIGAAPFTVSATAPGGSVTYTSRTTNKCTVSGNTVTLVGGQTGVCTIVADQEGDGVDYVPSSSVARSFTILAAATAPTNSGLPIIGGSVVGGGTLTLNEGTWADGGSPITGTTVQWKSTVSGVTTDLAGVTGSTCHLVPLAGSTITVSVTKTNAIGSTTRTSAATISGFTCAPPVAPSWTDQTLAPFTLGAPYTDGVGASGVPAATYAISAGALPAGLSLNATTGAITGTPTVAGAYSFTVTASNGVNPAATASFSGTVVDPTVPPALSLQVERGAGQPVAGAPVTVAGTGLKPFSDVTITFGDEVLEVVQTDSNGAFTTTVTLPHELVPGVHEIVATGTSPSDQPVETIERLMVDWTGAVVSAPHADGYTPVEPLRVLDTRSGAKVADGTVYRLPVGDDWGVDGHATNVVLNVTVTEPDSSGFVTVYPCGGDTPWASAVNFLAGQTVPNLVVVSTSPDAEVCMFTTATTHLVVDLNGFHGPSSEERLGPLDPVRILDTRASGKPTGGTVIEIPVVGDGMAPGGSTAAVLNVTVTEPEAPGFVTLFPCGESVPVASNLNFVAGQTVANQAFVKLGAEGSVCAYVMASTHLVVDLNGAFHDTETEAFAGFVPGRALDTRGGTKVLEGQIVELTLGTNGLQTATAFALNVTVTEPERSGFVTVYPCDGAVPWASNVNFTPGATVANHVTAKVGSGGRVCIFTSATTHLVVDVEGAYL